MSDPVSNAEVEDVLASIRRLVSEEKRPVATEAQNSSAETGKLVLTPSLRVMEPAPEAQDVQAADDESHAVQETDDPSADAGGETAPVGDEDAKAAENARMAAALVLGMSGGQKLSDAEALEAEEDDDPASETLVGAAFSVPFVGEADLTLDPFGNDAYAARTTAQGVEEPAADVVLTQADSDIIESAFSPDAPFAEDARDEPLSLSAKIAALEAAVGKRHDEWEPDGIAAQEPYSGTQAPSLAWDENTEDETVTVETRPADDSPEVEAEQIVQAELNVTPLRADLPAQEDAPVAVDKAADLLEDAALLDEDALRDMVAEIVREELQGALGERITRNVRKLVRREIQRALTAHDLD